MPEPNKLPKLKEYPVDAATPEVPKPTPPGEDYAKGVAAAVGGAGEVQRAFHPPPSRTFIHGMPSMHGGGKK